MINLFCHFKSTNIKIQHSIVSVFSNVRICCSVKHLWALDGHTKQVILRHDFYCQRVVNTYIQIYIANHLLVCLLAFDVMISMIPAFFFFFFFCLLASVVKHFCSKIVEKTSSIGSSEPMWVSLSTLILNFTTAGI